MPAGGSKRIAPEDRKNVGSSGRNCTIDVRDSPLGHVTRMAGAKPWPCRYTRSPATRNGWLTRSVCSFHSSVGSRMVSSSAQRMFDVNISAWPLGR